MDNSVDGDNAVTLTTLQLTLLVMNMVAANSGWRLRGRRARNFELRAGAMSDAARRELLIRGAAGSATVLGVRPRRSEPGHVFWVRVQVDGELPYETRVRQRMREDDLEWMQPGDVVCCRVDPGDRDRVVLYVPDIAEAGRASISKILSDGRRADATVLAAAPVAADYGGRDDPVLRLDLELRAWDEPKPWRVRLVQPVPLTAIGLVDLGQHLEVAFFTVDRGDSVAVDWIASVGED
jgi:translation initiation factor IF-1